MCQSYFSDIPNGKNTNEGIIMIKLFRLKSGEEIICEAVEDGHEWWFSKPLMLIPTQEGKLSFQWFMPYTKAPEMGVVMPKSYIAFEVEPVQDMVDQYESLVSPEEDKPSILVPNKKIVVD